MTLEQLEKEITDSKGKDQLEAVRVPLSMPRALWVEILEAMKVHSISQPSTYIANLVRAAKEQRERGHVTPLLPHSQDDPERERGKLGFEKTAQFIYAVAASSVFYFPVGAAYGLIHAFGGMA